MKKTTSGFTIVEMLVVIALIGILATISIVAYSSIRTNSRDSQRSSSISLIKDALEKYYRDNGEYPGCQAMAANPETVVTSTLKGLDPAVFTSPSGSAGTNSFQASCESLTSSSTTDYAYVGDSSDSCKTGNSCSQYVLEYREESSGDIKSTKSQHRPTVATSEPSSAPTVTVALNGASVSATINPVTCSGGATPQYQITNRANEGSWSGYTSWSGVNMSFSQPASEGFKYGYKAQARCFVNNAAYSTPVVGSESTYTHPISTIPMIPSVSANATSYNSTTYSWNAAACPTGTSARYLYDFTTSYGFDFGWVSTVGTSVAFSTGTWGYTYSVSTKAQCYTSFATGGWSNPGTANYVRPVPTIQVLVVGGGGGGGSDNGGGGGAGGIVYNPYKTIAQTGYSVVVGGGGGVGASGQNSTFIDMVGYGGARGANVHALGVDGGCGSGGGGSSGDVYLGGESIQTSNGGGTGYGFPGGAGGHRNDGYAGGGGGGSGQAGGGYNQTTAPGKENGGYGQSFDISGSSVQYAGGGGGGGDDDYHGVGGAGGGGNGGTGHGLASTAGVANTGGGGGGGGGGGRSGSPGGSGIVIIRYATLALGASGGTQYTVGSDTVHVFTSSGTFQVY